MRAETRYYPWGQDNRWKVNVTPTGARFTNQRLDDTLNLYNYNARYYDHWIGRFLSADTIVPDPNIPQSINRYSYVLNSPVNLTDPSGRCYPPAEWLRDVEPTNCANLDLAIKISQSPNATGWQKTGAYSYIGVWSTSHATLVTGLALAGGAGVQAIVGWGASFAIAHPTATTVIVAAANFGDEAAVIYGAATGNPQAQQDAIIAQQMAQMDGTLPFADTLAGVKFFGSRLRNGFNNAVEACSNTLRLIDGNVTASRGGNWFDVGSHRGYSPYGTNFYSVGNESGGRVWVSTEPISQRDFSGLVNTNNSGGSIHILSGTHGTPGGNLVPERQFFEDDFNRWRNTSNVTVSDVTHMNEQEVAQVINEPGRIICAWCYSERSDLINRNIKLK